MSALAPRWRLAFAAALAALVAAAWALASQPHAGETDFVRIAPYGAPTS